MGWTVQMSVGNHQLDLWGSSTPNKKTAVLSSLKLTFSHLKMDGWKTFSFSFGGLTSLFFRCFCLLLVLGSRVTFWPSTHPIARSAVPIWWWNLEYLGVGKNIRNHHSRSNCWGFLSEVSKHQKLRFFWGLFGFKFLTLRFLGVFVSPRWSQPQEDRYKVYFGEDVKMDLELELKKAVATGVKKCWWCWDLTKAPVQ